MLRMVTHLCFLDTMSIEYKAEEIYPSILLKNGWENIPENYVSIYHHTKIDNLERISNEGIIPYSEKSEEKSGEVDLAGVAELVYATDLKSVGGNSVWVQVPPPAPYSLS